MDVGRKGPLLDAGLGRRVLIFMHPRHAVVNRGNEIV